MGVDLSRDVHSGRHGQLEVPTWSVVIASVATPSAGMSRRISLAAIPDMTEKSLRRSPWPTLCCSLSLDPPMR